jgi:hypothetical protein
MAYLFERVAIPLAKRGGRLVAMSVHPQGEQAALPEPGATIGERLSTHPARRSIT